MNKRMIHDIKSEGFEQNAVDREEMNKINTA